MSFIWPPLLLAVLAEAALGQVHELSAGLGVLELSDVDVGRRDSGGLEGSRRRVGADAGGSAQTLDRGAEDLEGAKPASAESDRP